MTPNATSLVGLATQMLSPSAASVDAARHRKDDKAKDALAALQSLKSQRSSANEDKKAAARQKVEELKARIRALRMTMVGDPEAMAKIVARLARDLGAAVKAYAAAGGSATGMGMQAAPAGAGTAPADASGAEASAQGVMPEAAGETAQETPADPDATGEDASANKNPYRAIAERQQAEAAEQARKNADKGADARFASDVKSLMNELKAILRQAEQQGKREGDDGPSPGQDAADKALKEVQGALDDMTSPISGMGSLGGGVGAGMGLGVSVSLQV
ncbi:MAG: hypothetical protein EON88_11710 [Brevundimonas sp.]|nr:MAG: hypothetical protein EON88_11710 [Brevundimonas sp.]